MVFVDEAVGIELEEQLPIITCLFVLYVNLLNLTADHAVRSFLTLDVDSDGYSQFTFGFSQLAMKYGAN